MTKNISKKNLQRVKELGLQAKAHRFDSQVGHCCCACEHISSYINRYYVETLSAQLTLSTFILDRLGAVRSVFAEKHVHPVFLRA